MLDHLLRQQAQEVKIDFLDTFWKTMLTDAALPRGRQVNQEEVVKQAQAPVALCVRNTPDRGWPDTSNRPNVMHLLVEV